MDDLINSGAEAVSDPDGALMVVSAINSIIGGKMYYELFPFLPPSHVITIFCFPLSISTHVISSEKKLFLDMSVKINFLCIQLSRFFLARFIVQQIKIIERKVS